MQLGVLTSRPPRVSEEQPQIWGEQRIATKSWAIQRNPNPVDRILWERREVDIVDTPLDVYVDALESRVNAVAARA